MRAAQRFTFLWIVLAMVASTLLVYFPCRHDMSVIYRYFDGPLYMIVAKTLYNVPADVVSNTWRPYGLTPAYFATHLPMYPLLIRMMTWLTWGNYPVAMLVATILSSVGAALLFFHVLKTWNLVVSPL